MRTILHHLFVVAVSAGLAWAGAGAGAAAQDLRLKRVMLSTGGVGYFEYEAEVEGDAELELDVRLDQVDDVLKSIVVYDDQGGVGAISLPGRAPLEQVFRDLPFGPAALESPVALLNALQGAEVRAVGARVIEGRLIRVTPEVRQLPDQGGTVTRHRVSLMTAEGIQHLILEDARSLSFVDAELEAQVGRALAAIAAHRVRDRRTLRVILQGSGARSVRVAYVVAAPLWKASYRLTIADGEGQEEDSGLLQGWAVIENMSGQPWRDVELTLLSGNPVTFRQALYTAYYVDRPEVPVEVLGRILPRPDRGAVARLVASLEELRDEREGKAELQKRARSERATAMSMAPREVDAPPPPGMAPLAQAAVSAETATQVVFRLPSPVSVEPGHTLMVPIVNRRVPARRVSLYQPETHASHPLATVRLKNDTGSGLPPGVLTLYEQGAGGAGSAYLGDARIATFPLGEERLVSFALDQKTRVDRESRVARRVTRATVERGVLRLRVVRSQTTTYRLKAPDREDRVVLIEVPRRADWRLVEPREEEVELTDRHYRIERALAAGAEVAFEVTLERPVVETVRVDTLSLARMLAFASSTELSDELRRAFTRMAELQREVGRHERRLEELGAKRGAIFEEQKRIRDNINRVPRESDLYRRYLDKLNAQETELEEIAAGRDETKARIEESREALARYIRGLKV
jgi:hypothetical protein